MGVYIKGMKVPESCLKCPMQFGGWCYVSPSEIDERVAPTVDEAAEQGKPEWCPLVEVPEPHGRLIEAPDVSEYEVFDEDTGTREISLLGLMECHRMVENATAVIEAEWSE